jgi:energy-coupling factor transporter ATP-binding protein EcfA2
MIKSIEIENFRGIQHGKLDGLTPLTILVGPNGCGKSTVLDALHLVAHRDPVLALRVMVAARGGLKDAPRWLLWKTDLGSRCGIRIGYDSGVQRTVILGLSPLTDRDVLRGLPESFRDAKPPPSLRSNRAIGNQQNRGIGAGVGIAAQFPQISLDAVTTGEIESGNEVDFVDLTEPPKPGYLVDLFTKTRVDGRRDEVTELVRAVIPSAVTIEILTENGVPIIHIGYGTTSVPAALSGDGIYDLLRLCLKLASLHGGIVLLEEPEVHQHPGALRQTALAILAAVRRGIQVILSTHNLELIDFLLSECKGDAEIEQVSVARLKLDGGCLKSSTLSGAEAALSRFQIEDDLR